MARLKHPHVIHFVTSYQQMKSINYLIRLVADCNLLQYMTAQSSGTGYRSRMQGWFSCLASGLQYLHNSGVKHRDIGPGNILLRDDRILYTDFGSSVMIPDDDSSESDIYTYEWRSPNKNSGYSRQSDPKNIQMHISANRRIRRDADSKREVPSGGAGSVHITEIEILSNPRCCGEVGNEYQSVAQNKSDALSSGKIGKCNTHFVAYLLIILDLLDILPQSDGAKSQVMCTLLDSLEICNSLSINTLTILQRGLPQGPRMRCRNSWHLS